MRERDAPFVSPTAGESEIATWELGAGLRSVPKPEGWDDELCALMLDESARVVGTFGDEAGDGPVLYVDEMPGRGYLACFLFGHCEIVVLVKNRAALLDMILTTVPTWTALDFHPGEGWSPPDNRRPRPTHLRLATCDGHPRGTA